MTEPNLLDIPASVPPDQVPFFTAIKSCLEILSGQGRNTKNTRALRVNELSSLGMDVGRFLKSSASNPYNLITTSSSSSSESQEVPMAPSGLSIVKGPFAHMLTWTNPSDVIVSHIEVWAALSSQYIADADIIAIVTMTEIKRGQSDVYINSGLSVSYNYCYWIRAVSYAGKNSEWYPTIVTGGVVVKGDESISETIDSVMDVLQGGTPLVYNAVTNYSINQRCRTSDGRVWKSIYAGTHQGHLPPDATYWKRAGILMMGDVDGMPTIAVDGNLMVDDTILARHIQVGSIQSDHFDTNEAFVGLTIQSSNFVEGTSGWQLHRDGVLKIESQDSEIIIGNTVNGDYCEISDGDIDFYYWDASIASHVSYKSLKRTAGGVVSNGDEVEIPGLFLERPTIMVSPNTVQTYEASMSAVDQTLECSYIDLEEYNIFSGLAEAGTKRWRFTARALLIGSAAPVSGESIASPGGFATNLISAYIPDYIRNYTPVYVGATYTCPSTCVGLTIVGSAIASFTKQAPYWSHGVSVSITLVIDGVGSWIIGSKEQWGADSTSGSVSVSLNGFTKAFSVGPKTYHFEMQSAGWIYRDGSFWNQSTYTSGLYVNYILNTGSQSAAGSLNWTAIGI